MGVDLTGGDLMGVGFMGVDLVGVYHSAWHECSPTYMVAILWLMDQ